MYSMAGAKTPNGANASVDAGLVWLAGTVVTPARVRSSQPVMPSAACVTRLCANSAAAAALTERWGLDRCAVSGRHKHRTMTAAENVAFAPCLPTARKPARRQRPSLPQWRRLFAYLPPRQPPCSFPVSMIDFLRNLRRAMRPTQIPWTRSSSLQLTQGEVGGFGDTPQKPAARALQP